MSEGLGCPDEGRIVSGCLAHLGKCDESCSARFGCIESEGNTSDDQRRSASPQPRAVLPPSFTRQPALSKSIEFLDPSLFCGNVGRMRDVDAAVERCECVAAVETAEEVEEELVDEEIEEHECTSTPG